MELGLRLRHRQPRGDLAELGGAPGRHDDAGAVSRLDDSPHEHAAGEVANAGAGIDGARRLARGEGFAGHDALVAREVVDCQQPDVGGHHAAHRQAHDVARDEVGHIELGRLRVSNHRHRVPDLIVQRVCGVFGPELIDEPKADARGEDDADDDGICLLTQEQ
nr:hypothetical protein [Flaviflexus salsibiostraticola]